MFILHGEEDKICTPAGSQRLHDQAASQDKTLKVIIHSKGGGRMWSFLEPKPKFGVTPFINLNHFVPVFLILI